MSVVAATRNITKAKDIRDDTKLLMAPYANWEEFLMPGPISIAILGELVFISSSTDFSINKNPPKDGFKFIRYPKSFRACLMQVTNSGWAAFNEAHKNMDQIRVHSDNVGRYVKTAVKTLMQDDDQLVEMLLPDQLDNIATIAKECIALSASTETKFAFVISLIQELMEASVNAKAAYGEEMAEMQRKIAESKLRKAAAEEHKRRTEKSLEQLNKQLEETSQQYKKSMDSMPSGWEVVGMNFVEGFSTTVTSTLNGFVKMMAKPSMLVLGGIGDVVSQVGSKIVNKSLASSSKKKQVEHADPIASNKVYSKSGQVIALVYQMNDVVEKNCINLDKLYFDKKKENSVPAWLQQQFQDIEDSISEEDCEPAAQCLKMCKKAIDVCKTLASITQDGKSDDKVTKQLIGELTNLKDMAAKFDTQSKAFTGTSSFTATPPQLSSKQSASQMASDNARFRIEQSRAQLKEVQEMVQKTTDTMQQNHKELTDILVTLQNCEVKEIDFKTCIEMLVKGLDAMGKVKEQWEKMVRFFQMISNIIKNSLGTTLNDFVKTASKPGINQLSYTAKNFMRDMLYQQAFHSSNIASLVNMISGTYTEVSNRYLMDRISSLGKLMGMDPTMPDFQTERCRLRDGCNEASEGIKALVLKNKQDFDRNTEARIAKIEKEMLAVLPPATEEEIKKIKDIVDSGMKNLPDDDQFA